MYQVVTAEVDASSATFAQFVAWKKSFARSFSKLSDASLIWMNLGFSGYCLELACWRNAGPRLYSWALLANPPGRRWRIRPRPLRYPRRLRGHDVRAHANGRDG